MNPSTLESMITLLLPLCATHVNVNRMKALTPGLKKIVRVSTIRETVESVWLTQSDQN